jgi:hypothetical protein
MVSLFFQKGDGCNGYVVVLFLSFMQNFYHEKKLIFACGIDVLNIS